MCSYYFITYILGVFDFVFDFASLVRLDGLLWFGGVDFIFWFGF